MSELKREKIIRTETGEVVSAKMNKTITVLIERKIQHPLYKKFVKRSTKIKAHDEENQCVEGDTVRIQETRPISKNKSWKLVEILGQAVGKNG
jgi:small subunit ribosomal protein S17